MKIEYSKIINLFFFFQFKKVWIQDLIMIKGVLHPRLLFGLFLHFSQKLQHIGNK